MQLRPLIKNDHCKFIPIYFLKTYWYSESCSFLTKASSMSSLLKFRIFLLPMAMPKCAKAADFGSWAEVFCSFSALYWLNARQFNFLMFFRNHRLFIARLPFPEPTFPCLFCLGSIQILCNLLAIKPCKIRECYQWSKFYKKKLIFHIFNQLWLMW